MKCNWRRENLEAYFITVHRKTIIQAMLDAEDGWWGRRGGGDGSRGRKIVEEGRKE